MGPGWPRNAMFHFILFQNGIFDAGLPQVGGSDANPSDLNEDPDHESRCSSREGRGYVANIYVLVNRPMTLGSVLIIVASVLSLAIVLETTD